jgi:hypothetical protein
MILQFNRQIKIGKLKQSDLFLVITEILLRKRDRQQPPPPPPPPPLRLQYMSPPKIACVPDITTQAETCDYKKCSRRINNNLTRIFFVINDRS